MTLIRALARRRAPSALSSSQPWPVIGERSLPP